jgi:3-deoxy-D-arabino-heptulosonate 7-phosphate (DAHP) synthase
MIKNDELTIIAGPDSIDEYNINEIYQIAELKANGQYAITGTRTVGLKSRTSFDKDNSSKGFMGLDFEQIIQYQEDFANNSFDSNNHLKSIDLAREIYNKTGLLCSTEIMLPNIQLPIISIVFKDTPFMIWNPAVDQLGWHVRDMALFAQKNDWLVGLKNPKWVGEEYDLVEKKNYENITSMEKAWSGLVDYAKPAKQIVMIQRGVDVPNKGLYRNLPVHNIASRTKQRLIKQNIQMFFDPSHALGGKKRDQIVEETVEAMKLKIDEQNYLYDGILIEVGTAKCDTDQHITVSELDQMIQEISKFRVIQGRI